MLAGAIGVVAIGLAARIAIAWVDVGSLTIKVLPDDAFYYFETAFRIRHGQNITFDGTTLANGYHPLWLFFLVPFYLLPGKSLPIHLALTVSSIFDVTAGILVALAVWKLTQKQAAALFALTFYVFLPQNIFAAVNGVESSLAAMMVAALLLVVTVAWREEQTEWIRWSVITGVVAGMAVLARLDTALLVLLALALIAVFQSGKIRWRAPLLAGVITFLVVSPWLLWSWVAIGSPVPVSAAANTLIAKRIFQAANPGSTQFDELKESWTKTKEELNSRAPALYFPSRRFSTAALGLAFLVVGHFLIFARGTLRTKLAKQALVPLLPMAGFLFTLLLNAFYRWSVREWYYAWGMPTVVCFVGLLFAYLDDIVGSLPRLKAATASAVGASARGLLLYGAIVGLLFFAYYNHGMDRWKVGLYPFQLQPYEAAQYLKTNTAPDERASAFNAGVLGYFSDREVVNMDGVVNPDAYNALRGNRLLAYLRSAHVTYTADFDYAWNGLPGYAPVNGDWSKGFWGEDPNKGFVQIKQIGFATLFGQHFRVFRVLEAPSETPP